jgi:hypothetical protein
MRCQARGASPGDGRPRFFAGGERIASAALAPCVAMAARQMIVHHADRLHEGVDDRRSAEFEPRALDLWRGVRKWLRRRVAHASSD